MKLVVAVIHPTKLKAVQEALAKVDVQRITICDSLGYSRERGEAAVYRGIEFQADLLRKVTLEIAVNDDYLERTIETITNIARTGSEGNTGDGKIFVLPIESVVQLGGTERGKSAI